MPASSFEGMDHDAVLQALRERAADVEARARRMSEGFAAATATASSPAVRRNAKTCPALPPVDASGVYPHANAAGRSRRHRSAAAVTNSFA